MFSYDSKSRQSALLVEAYLSTVLTIMTISKTEAKQLLERLIFDDEGPSDWVQDVWGLSPTLGDSAAKLLDAFEALIECCPQEQLENLLQTLYQEQLR